MDTEDTNVLRKGAMIQYETMLMWLSLILDDLEITEILCGRGGEGKKAPFLLKWLKCGITSLKEILDGAESKQTRKTKCEVLMLKCERKLRAHCLGLQLSGNDLSFLWNPISYVFLITPESTHLYTNSYTISFRGEFLPGSFRKEERGSFLHGIPRLGTWQGT